MKLVSMLVAKLLRLLGIFSLVIRGFSNRNLLERMKEIPENYNRKGDLDQIYTECPKNGEDIVFSRGLKQIIGTLESKLGVRHKELRVGEDTQVRIIKRSNKFSPIFDLRVEFGSSKNPLYYRNIDQKAKCSMLLSLHFRKYMLNLFENHLEKLNNVFSESHVYFEGDRYHLELRNADNDALISALKHVSIFFTDIIIRSDLIKEYFLELRSKGNVYFLPDNVMKETFLSIINTQGEYKYSNDIYGRIRSCVIGLDYESFAVEYSSSFIRRLKSMDVFLSSRAKIKANQLVRLIKYYFEMNSRDASYFGGSRNGTPKRESIYSGSLLHPYSVLTGRIIQISSSRMGNKLVFMFPMKNHTYFQKYRISKFIETAITENEDFKRSMEKFPWIEKISYQFEYNKENKFSNLLINFHSKEKLNGEGHPDRFNLVQVLELWLENILVKGKNMSIEGKSHFHSHSQVQRKASNKASFETLSEENNKYGSKSHLVSQILANLGLNNIIIIIYSSQEIRIKGRDIINMNTKSKENKYHRLVKRCLRFSYIVRKRILPIFGLKYIHYNEEYYFSTKFLSQKLPKSVVKYLRERYESKSNYR